MRMLGDRLLLKAPKAPEKIGRLWVPPEAQKDFVLCQAEVVAIGKEVKDPRLLPGVHIICKRFGAVELDKDKREWVIFEGQVLAVLDA